MHREARWRWSALLCALAWAPAAIGPAISTREQPALRNPLPRSPLSFSFTWDPGTHKVFVEGRLSGARSKFLLDTGAPNSYLHDTVALELGVPLETANYEGEPYVLNGKALEYIIWPHTVIGGPGEFRGVDLGNMFYYLLPGDKVPGDSVLHEDGILGANAFEQSAILLDFPARTMGVWPGGHLSGADVKAIGFERAFTVPIFKSGSAASWMARAQVTNGSMTGSCDLVIDTGADYSYLPATIGKQLNLTPLDSRKAVGGFNQTFDLNATVIPQLQLGGMTLNDCRINYLGHEVDGFTGSIGTDILSSCRVLIDYPAHTMYLVPTMGPTQVAAATANH